VFSLEKMSLNQESSAVLEYEYLFQSTNLKGCLAIQFVRKAIVFQQMIWIDYF